MGNEGQLQGSLCLDILLQHFLQVGSRRTCPCRYHDESHQLSLQTATGAYPVHRLNEHVDTFIAILIASARRYQQSIRINRATSQLLCHLDQSSTGSCPLFLVGLNLWHEVRLKAIRRHDIRLLIEQLLTFTSRNVAHGREAIHMVRGLLLHGMLRLHVQLASHLIAVVAIHIGIQRLVIAGDRATNRGCMRSEDRRDRGDMLLDIERTHRQHPLIEEANHPLLFQMVEMVEALHYLTHGQSKDARLVIIAIRMNGIHLETLPHRIEEGIALLKERLKIHQDHRRITRHIPTTNLNLQLVNRLGVHTPISK